MLAQLALYPRDKGWHPKEPTLVAGGPFCVLFSSREHRAPKGRDSGYIYFLEALPFQLLTGRDPFRGQVVTSGPREQGKAGAYLEWGWWRGEGQI